ncbi:MAG TPA: tetratricopeptide repeat protein, partial [Gammaproteobacteria bacterium]
HVWAQRYDKQLVDLFAVQDEVTQHIVTALALQLTDQEQRALAEVTHGNMEAYELVLRGLEQFNIQTAEANRRAQSLYRQAIETDPSYGRAYGALAISLSRGSNRGWEENPEIVRDRALELANRAVKLSPELPQVHWALGFVHLFRGEPDAAAAAIERAVTVAPSYADGYGLLALVENRRGNGEKALPLVRKAMALNPYYTWDYLYNLGFAYYQTGAYAEAADALERALARNENAGPPRVILAATYAALGRLDDASWEVNQLSMQYDYVSLSTLASGNERPEFIFEPERMQRLLGHLREAGVPE